MKSLIKQAGLTALGVVTAVGLATGNAQAAETIKIGSFLAVTGGASFLGDPEKKTLEMYVDKINAEGGVLGKKLELIVYDSGGSPKKAVPFAKRLINDDKVDIILAGSTTGATMAVIPIVEKAGIPFISFGGAGVIVDPVKKWVFKTPHTDTLAVQKIFKDMKGRGISKIGLLSGSGGFDKSCRDNVLKLASGAGITLAADETHGKGDTDMTTQITKIKNTAGVQAMLYCGFGAATSIVAKNFKQLGANIPHYQTHGSASKSFIKNADGGAEGVRLPAAALVVVDALPDSHVQKKVAGSYKKMYESKTGSEISTFGGHAYDGLMIAIEAIKRAGSTDKAAVRAEIEKTKNYIGVDGVYSMSATDHLGLDEASFVMVEVSGGDWKMLK
ncbi:MAG: ABC transporter substrate-binding protein [Rhodospirillales bacterium]|nr:ABC transporter substrate-binding protein [Rhodospirillales bacterium]